MNGAAMREVQYTRHIRRESRRAVRIPRAPTSARSAFLGLLALAALASARADEGDPPSRVARLSYVEGSVSLEPAGMQEWTAAERNRPLTTGDRLWTDQD
jgi:hypothetical protein